MLLLIIDKHKLVFRLCY